MLRNVVIVILICKYADAVDLECPSDSLTRLPLVLEYAVWRGWRHSIIFAPELHRGCQWSVVRLVKCLGLNGIAASVDGPYSPLFRSHLGIVILTPTINDNTILGIRSLLEKLIKEEMNIASYDWLISVKSDEDFNALNAILNGIAIRFDQNIVVAYPRKLRINSNFGLCHGNFAYFNSYERRGNKSFDEYQCYSNKSCSKFAYERNYYRASVRFMNLTRKKVYKRFGRLFDLYQDGILNYHTLKPFVMTNISKFSLNKQYLWWREDNTMSEHGIHLVQYFKVRTNSTLYAYYLGFWTRADSMSGVDTPFPVDARTFLGENLIMGRCNLTMNGASSADEEEAAAPSQLDDVVRLLAIKLNATPVTHYHTKLGYRTFEGTWTGLLGAMIDRSVDLALEPVTAHPSRYQDMDFIFPIAGTMYNIYIRQQETSTARDIFMTPFSRYLVVSVVAIVLLAATAIALVSRFVPARGFGRSAFHRRRPMEYTEALIWSTAILCQQGGPSTPKGPAASILLIVCLLFAVVTYNAYAAFITSVLSVRVASLGTIDAVLRSPHFKIGYIKNGADQMYLMSTKDVRLNVFYIRGYSEAENLVSSAEEGLARAAKQDYAFFANQRTARTTLRSLSQDRGRCAVKELPVYSTRAHIAFPIAHRSPYGRPTLISILQLHSTGAIARLEAALVPAMPECVPPPDFASARAIDVKSALFLIASGLVISSFLGIAEYCWMNRKKLQTIFSAVWIRIFNALFYYEK